MTTTSLNQTAAKLRSVFAWILAASLRTEINPFCTGSASAQVEGYTSRDVYILRIIDFILDFNVECMNNNRTNKTLRFRMYQIKN